VWQVVPSTFEENLDKSLFRSAADYARETALRKAMEVATRRWDEQEHPVLVIGADTVVELCGDILEKPRDAADAKSMLGRCACAHACNSHAKCILKGPVLHSKHLTEFTQCRLSGQTHSVHTGVALVLPSPRSAPDAAHDVHGFSCTTAVEFDTLTAADIHTYIASGGLLMDGWILCDMPHVGSGWAACAGEPFGKAGAYGIQGVAGAFVRRVEGCYWNVVGFPANAFGEALAGLCSSGRLKL
jgi:septum formation protein